MTDIVMELERAIYDLAQEAEVTMNRFNISLDVEMAMGETRRKDLLAMLKFLKTTDMEPGQILANVMHDCLEFRRRYLKPSLSGDGFSPRSAGYHKRMVLASMESQTEDTIDQAVEDLDFDDLIIVAQEWNCDTGILQLPGDMWPDAEAELRVEVVNTWYDTKDDAKLQTEGSENDN